MLAHPGISSKQQAWENLERKGPNHPIPGGHRSLEQILEDVQQTIETLGGGHPICGKPYPEKGTKNSKEEFPSLLGETPSLDPWHDFLNEGMGGGGEGEGGKIKERVCCDPVLTAQQVNTPGVVSVFEGSQSSQNGELVWAPAPR